MESPWLDHPLRVKQSVLDELDGYARREYPNECCGFLTGPAADTGLLDAAVPAVNRADFYHERLPDEFPRTAKTFYVIDPRVIMNTFERAAGEGRPVKVIYHSHCDAGAYFSAEDRAAAAPDGQLMYPVVFLVTSVRDGVVEGRKFFALRAGAWVEAAFTVE